MELINDLQIEVTKIAIMKNGLMNKQERYVFKKLIFVALIESIEEYAYFYDGKFRGCSMITMKDGEYFKVKDKYEDLKKLHIDFFEMVLDDETTNETGEQK